MAQPALLMMWMAAWLHVPCGSMPADDAVIRSKCRVPVAMWPRLRDVLMRGWWMADDGRMYHDTISARVLEMLEYRRKTAERVAKHKLAMREQRGGNALLTVKNDTGTGTGSKEEEPIQKTKTARKRAAPAALVSVDDMVADGVDRQHAVDWLVARKAKALPLTPTAWADTKAQAIQAGMTPGEAIKAAAGNGWAGFKAAWLQPHGRNGVMSALDRKTAENAKWVKGTSLDPDSKSTVEAKHATPIAIRP